MSKKAVNYQVNEKDIDTVLKIMKKTNPNATPEMAIDFLENTAAGIHQLSHSDPEKLEKIYDELQQGSKNIASEKDENKEEKTD